MSASEVLRQLGPALERSQLLAAGVTLHQIAVERRLGTIVRLRRAWYALPDAPLDIRIAVALGGRLGSLSAARSYGLWVGVDRAIHVSWPAHGNVALPGRRLEYPRNKEFAGTEIVQHWSNHEGPRRPDWRESIEQTTIQVLRGRDRVTAVACVDSALRTGLLTEAALRTILDRMPARVPALSCFDGTTASGLESMVRLWLLERGIRFRMHVYIEGVGEVDFVVGQSLIVETDGEEFHSDSDAFERDRRRDNASSLRGYITSRLSYRMVMEDWPSVEDRLLHHIRRGDHLRPTT